MSTHRLLCLAIGIAALPAAVHAQTADKPPARDAGTLEEVVVTAERREASLQTVPIAVSAISTETLEKLQVTEARSLERYVPSLRMSNNVTSPTNLSPSLRGSLQQDASLIVAESPFGIYVDDVYIGRLNGNNVTLADIERVEVLRGPQGTLYGRNTLAGAIKFVSRNPGDSSWLRASVGGGNYGQYLGSISMGGPISDNWAASFSGQFSHKDGAYRNVTTGLERGMEESEAVRMKLQYTGSETFDAVFSVAYTDSENDAVQLLPGSTPADPMGLRQFTSDEVLLTLGNSTVATPNQVYPPGMLSNQPRGDTEQLIASANLSWDIGAATIRSITAYVKTDDYFSTDFGGAGFLLGASDPRAEQYTQELQISGTAFNDRMNYLAGVYYLKETGEQDFGWFFRPLGGVSTSQIDASTKSYSVFGQFDYAITDSVKATVGARWVKDEKDFKLDFQYRFAPIPAEQVIRTGDFDELTPKFGLDWTVDADWADSLLVYGSAARGFKSGGFNGINIFNAAIAQTVYDPESNWTYELGTKMDLFGRTVRINAAAFFADVSDIAMNSTVVIGGNVAFPVDNQGDAEIKGLEIETTWVPVDNLTVFANLALLDGKYKDVLPGSAAADAPTLYQVEATPPQLPDYTISFGFDYGYDISLGSGGGRVKFGADMYRTDDYVTSATNDFVVKAYNRINAFVGLDIGESWDVRLAAKNLANDREVFVGARALGGYLVLPPREYMFTVTYKQ
jgi:iron complex outermembrane receptor protein